MPYRFRNLPCTIRPDHLLWCVSGIHNEDGTAGILEWCYDESDALYQKFQMERHGDFSNLKARAYKENTYEVEYQIKGGPALGYQVEATSETEARRKAAAWHRVQEPGNPKIKGKPKVRIIREEIKR